jgi:hypothetical protein
MVDNIARIMFYLKFINVILIYYRVCKQFEP